MTDILALTLNARGKVIPVIMTYKTTRPPIIIRGNTGTRLVIILNVVKRSINAGRRLPFAPSLATILTSVGVNVEILVGSLIEDMVSGKETDGEKFKISVALNVTVNTSLVEVDKGVGVSIGMTDGLIEPVGTSFAVTTIDDTAVVEYEVSGGVADILTGDASVFEADAGARFTSDPSSVEIEVGTRVVFDDS